MKKLTALLFCAAFACTVSAQEKPTLKSVLLEQLRNTHNKEAWFVPLSKALAGLTPEQAMWHEGNNHSVGQLANHLLFWNKQVLDKFKGNKPDAFSGNNDETFNNFTKDSWAKVVAQLDAVLTEMEKFIEESDDAKLQSMYATIANVSTHNAYHTGQILYVRKLQGAWNPDNGVK